MNVFNSITKFLFFRIIARFIVLVVLGINIRRKQNLPQKGPAIIVANHNSHLDTLVLLDCLPKHLLPITQPVAAEDYFMKNKFLAWFATNIINIIPIQRHKTTTDPLEPCYAALEQNHILILFPEGTRGEPEQMAVFKKGIAYMATKFPHVPVIPVYIKGLGKALPKGEFLLVPFFCDMYIGASINGITSKEEFMQTLQDRFAELKEEAEKV